MNTEDVWARRIIREGWYAPSTKLEDAGGGETAARARWAPFWSHPALRSSPGESSALPDREAVERLVDARVRAAISTELREAAFRALDPRYGVPHTPLERWAYGLLTDAPERAPAVPDWLADDIAEWLGAIERDAAAADVRVAFALLEPDRADGAWRLVPGLQAADEETLFVSARRVWMRPERDPAFGGRIFRNAHDALARGLAEAAERFSPLARSRIDRSDVALTEAEALDFLEAGAAALERRGFATLLPSWWHAPAPLEAAVHYRERPREGVAAAGAAGVAPALGFDTLLSFRKELLLGGAPIAEDEWRRLTEREAQLLFRDGRWFRIRAADRRAGARFFREALEGETTASEALRTALTAEAAGAAEPETGAGRAGAVPLRRWSGGERLERLVAGLRRAAAGDGGPAEPLPTPPQLRGELRDYQARGFSWLVRMRELGLGACLADDMGLGKTIQWIAYALHVVHAAAPYKTGKPLLLICPTSVLGNWQRELERFAPTLRVYFHYGPERLHGEAFRAAAAEADIVLTSYSTALRDRKPLGGTAWDAVTLDEAQYVKNSGAQLTRFVRTLPSVHRIALTGTPVENRLSDLWSIFEYLNPGYLGGERSFRKTFGDGTEGEAASTAAKRLHALVRPFLLRRMKTDPTVIGDLPEKIEQTSYCGMTERQAAMYAATLERMAEQLRHAEGIRRRGVILSTLTRLKQICNAPEQALRERTLRAGSSGKLLRLEELLRESLDEADGRCIVFTQYAAMATLLQSYLAAALDCEVGLMIGKTPRKDRETLVARFQEAKDGPRILVLSLKTGGFGLNLTRANRLIHYDRWWNPAAERQATDRAYRIGQTRTVEVWKLVTKGTLEESIERLLESKERLAEDVVGAGETWLTEYDDERLQDLLALRRQVVLAEEDA